MTGWIKIAGLGPGDAALVTPQVSDAITQATDVIGYIPYVKRIAPRDGLTLHATDNRVEIERSQHALELAVDGKNVLVVSSGDPGVFAMAAAMFEAMEAGPNSWHNIDVSILPGITAMLAASAAIGAPLGHDFCAINLSDNLKPWTMIEKRLRLACQADFAMAFYNPRSKSRPHQFAQALTILRDECESDRLIFFARAVSTDNQSIQATSLEQATPEMADMRTLVIVGSSTTRQVGSTNHYYTPRSVEEV